MAYNYTKARARAKKIITKFGKPSSLIKKGTTGGFSEGGNVEADSPDVTIIGIITPLIKYKTNEIDGESIIIGDSFAYFHTESNLDIEIDMQTTVNGQTFSVKSIKILSSVDDINIYTRLQLRK